MPRFIMIVIIFGMFPIYIFAQNNKVFKAGASESNITPWLGLPIVGNWGTPLADHIHDELFSKCLILDDGETQLVYVLIDNVGVPQWVFDEAKEILQEKTGIPKNQVLMAAVHNHSAVSAGGQGRKRKGYSINEPFDEYQKFLIRKIVDGVQVAINRLEPARIGWGSVEVPHYLFNRRYLMKEPVMNPFGEKDRALMNPKAKDPNIDKPAGPTDPEVAFISVQTIDGRPLSILANYSLHYVGGVPRGHISGDYFAVFADRIQELLDADRQDPPFVGIMSNGTSADVNSSDKIGEVEKYAPYEKMKVVGNDVAESVFNAYKNIKHFDWVELKVRQSQLPLKIRRGTPEMFSNIQKVLDRPESESPLYHRLEKNYAKKVMQMSMEWPDEIKVILQTFQIGDLGIAAIPFEVFTETGLEIKSKSPYDLTFTIEIANGYYGYLPTPEQHELGGYETWMSTNFVEKEATIKIVDELMKLFDEIY